MKSIKQHAKSAIIAILMGWPTVAHLQIRKPNSPQIAQHNERWDDLNDTIVQRMDEWKIPGMAVTIVRGDSTLFQSSYGFADVGRAIPVTNHTLFAIGSCTKFFTATGLSVLADQGKMDFFAPVINYYPELMLADTVLRNEITVRDILSHRTGLESGDYIWYGSDYTRQEVLDRLVHLRKLARIRDAFIYNNMMYTLAGTLIERQSGVPYEVFLKQQIFDPIQLNNTRFELPRDKSIVALPYTYVGQTYTQLPMPRLKGVEPAGGIWSNIDDLSKWLKFHLSTGHVDTVSILSEAQLTLLKKPVHFTGQNMRADETAFKSYGLGVGFSAYKGYRVMYHTGVAGGYTAIFAFLPEENIGIAILTNTDTYLFGLMNNLFDKTLGLPMSDWNSAIVAAYAEQRMENEQEAMEQAEKIKNAAVVKDTKKYTGVYQHAFKKEITITEQANSLSLIYNGITYPLGMVSADECVAYDQHVFGEIWVTFERDPSGNAESVKLSLMGQDMWFTRR